MTRASGRTIERWMLLSVLAIVSVALPRPALAWGKTGHRVVAAIAWVHMSPAARAAAVRILMTAPANSRILELRPAASFGERRDEEWFIDAATWPDLVRVGPHAAYSHPSWHFTDHYWRSVGGRAADVDGMSYGTASSVTRLVALEAELKDTSVASAQKAVDLAWMIHLMGDVHQPLHNSSRITGDAPKGDWGGNVIAFNSSVNLHSYWDGILDLVYESRRTVGQTKAAVKAKEKEPEYVQTWASEIMKDHPPSVVRGGEPIDDFDGWSREGLALAQGHAYERLRAGAIPDARYQADVEKVAKREIAEAGYRLAVLLNRTLR